MTIKENIEQMLGAIASGKTDEAQDMFNDILAQKAAERLDAYKVDVADSYFNGFKEGTDDVMEDVEQLDEISKSAVIAAAKAASDPDGDYDKEHFYSIKTRAERKFGNDFGKNIEGAADSHFPRKNHTFGNDRLAWRTNRSMGKTTVTKAGKLTKTAQQGLKSTIKNDLK